MINCLLILALSIVAPRNGAEVPLLRPAQKAYLAQSRADRFKLLDDAAFRNQIILSGYTQPPVKLEWTNATTAISQLVVEKLDSEGVVVSHQKFSITNSTRAYITNLEVGREYRWKVESGGETAYGGFLTEDRPPRLMRIEGVINARDLGGWQAREGARVRQNMIFRTAGFRGSASKKDKSIFSNRFEPGGQEISDAAIRMLRDEIRVKTDIEIRSVMETVCMSSSILGPSVEFVKEPFAAYDFIDSIIRGREPFARIFRHFVNAANYPIVFHCAGGRDRTGTLAFLLLGLLGVSDDDLCRDWEASIFSEEGTEFGTSRIDRLSDYLRSLGGNTLAENCEIFAKSCGVTDVEIEAFRVIMLERGGQAQ